MPTPINVPIPASFIQFTAPSAYGDCAVPAVSLPMLNPSDLSFQLLIISPDGTDDYRYAQKIFNPGVEFACQSGPDCLGTLGARVCLNCDEGATVTDASDFQWICTGASYINFPYGGFSLNGYILFFQPTGMLAEWNALPSGTCFNICIYQLVLYRSLQPCKPAGPFENIPGINPWDSLGRVDGQVFCSNTVFYKIADECEAYPTAVLQYANITDAFGFYYDVLGHFMAPGINFLNSIRLPLYLHSPGQSEEQTSYALSDGSSLKLSHRIWTDYKFKTDYLTADLINALVIATAHDLVYIICHYAGLDPWAEVPGIEEAVYYSTGKTTQFVRSEKVGVEWKQEEMPRFKLGAAKGTIRLALPASTVNTNCY